MTIGQRITSLRKQNNLTQDQLAHAAGISRASVINYENETTAPGKNILLRIVTALNVSWEQFQTGKLPQVLSRVNRHDTDILEIYRKKNKHLLQVIADQEKELEILQAKIEEQEAELLAKHKQEDPLLAQIAL